MIAEIILRVDAEHSEYILLNLMLNFAAKENAERAKQAEVDDRRKKKNISTRKKRSKYVHCATHFNIVVTRPIHPNSSA